MDVKICIKCNIEKELSLFTLRKYKSGNQNYSSVCKQCNNARALKRIHDNPERLAEKNRKHRERRQKERKDKSKTSKFILNDSKQFDKKKNLENDLTIEFIDEVIKSGCMYCGNTTLRMTLDRIDNTIGHLQNNVISSCIRCNYIRGSMPYEAWLVLKDGLIYAEQNNLFGNWTGSPHKH